MCRLACVLAVAGAIGLASATSASATYLTPDNTINWTGWVPFQDPHGIAVDPSGERVYVADSGRNLIQVFSDGGIPLYRLGGRGTTDGKMIDPTGVAVDSHGAVYVADTGNGRIVKFAANGNFIRAFSVPFVFRVAASPQGRIYALTNFFGLVGMRSPSGDDLGAWKAVFPGNFWFYQGYDDPTDDVQAIATDTSGRVLIAGISSQHVSDPPPDCHNVNQRRNWVDPLQSGEVVRFTGAGTALGYAWLNDSPKVCTRDPYSYGKPRGLASDPNDQTIYVADGEHHIDQLPGNLNSSNQGVVGSYFNLPCPQCSQDRSKYFSTEPLDAAMDCRSNLYVLTPDRVIKYLSPAGTSSSTCKKPPQFYKQLAISQFPLRTKHGFVLKVDCMRTKCVGSLDVAAHATHCHGLCVAQLTKSFRFGRGKAHEIVIPPHGLLGRLLRLGVPLKLKIVARNRKHRVIDTRSAVLREPSSLVVTCPSRGTVDKPSSVSGLLTPARTSPRIVVSYTTAGGTSVRHQVTPGPKGHWSDSFKPGRAGTLSVDVYWAGNGRYMPAHVGCQFPVVRVPSSLTLFCSFGFIMPDTDYTFTGKLTPAVKGSKVTLTYMRPNSTKFVRTVTTAADGTYGYKFHEPDYGNWRADAHFFGDRTRNPSDAPTCAFQQRYP